MNTTRPTELSLIVLTKDRVERCHDSINHNAQRIQDVPSEIIVVNNGQQPLSFEEDVSSVPCRVLSLRENRGIAAKNLGLRKAKSPVVLVLDDDAYLPKRLARSMLKAFRADPGLGCMGFSVRNRSQEESCLLPTVFHGCACAFRRDALLAIGGYPEHFVYYGEEYDLTFRLIQAGYRLSFAAGLDPVFHARDPAGRNKENIFRFLVRNNVSSWAANVPWSALPFALYDTLHRYYVLSKKEEAYAGFRRGVRDLPKALFRGLATRKALPQQKFNRVTLLMALDRICDKVELDSKDRIILCGLGKFPSLWIRWVQRRGIQIDGIWDFNSGWQDKSFRGLPLTVVREEIPSVSDRVYLLVGLVSRSDNARWKDLLVRHGFQAVHTYADEPTTAADLASLDTHRPLLSPPLTLYLRNRST